MSVVFRDYKICIVGMVTVKFVLVEHGTRIQDAGYIPPPNLDEYYGNHFQKAVPCLVPLILGVYLLIVVVVAHFIVVIVNLP